MIWNFQLFSFFIPFPFFWFAWWINRRPTISGEDCCTNGRQGTAAPSDWYFGGWELQDSFDGDGNPNPNGQTLFADAEVDCYVLGIEKVAGDKIEGFGLGSPDYHMIISPDPLPAGGWVRFQRTVEGGHCGTFSHGKSQYFRQIHFYQKKTLSENLKLLKLACRNQTPVNLKMILTWSEFSDKRFEKIGQFYGWDDRVTCPIACQIISQLI
jgi:hypothetical protein